MKKSIGLVAAAILSSTLTSCSLGSDRAGTEISRPGSEVTESAKQKPKTWPRDPKCPAVRRTCPV